MPEGRAITASFIACGFLRARGSRPRGQLVQPLPAWEDKECRRGPSGELLPASRATGNVQDTLLFLFSHHRRAFGLLLVSRPRGRCLIRPSTLLTMIPLRPARSLARAFGSLGPVADGCRVVSLPPGVRLLVVGGGHQHAAELRAAQPESGLDRGGPYPVRQGEGERFFACRMRAGGAWIAFAHASFRDSSLSVCLSLRLDACVFGVGGNADVGHTTAPDINT